MEAEIKNAVPVLVKEKVTHLGINLTVYVGLVCWKLQNADKISKRSKWVERHTVLLDWYTHHCRDVNSFQMDQKF